MDNEKNLKPEENEYSPEKVKHDAEYLVNQGLSVEDYKNGVQAARISRLATFKKYNVQVLIKSDERLIQFGEEVMKEMTRLYNEKKS